MELEPFLIEIFLHAIMLLSSYSIPLSFYLTFALASLAASASAAMARWSWTGSRTSLLEGGKEEMR